MVEDFLGRVVLGCADDGDLDALRSAAGQRRLVVMADAFDQVPFFAFPGNVFQELNFFFP